MILETNSINVFVENTRRTEMLIQSMDKIKAYNILYRFKAYGECYENAKLVEEIQKTQLEEIENSCSEHAIISLATTFETFCKEFIQQLLFEFPLFFQEYRTKYSKTIDKLITDKTDYDYEVITRKLGLINRFDFIDFFKEYDLLFLSKEEINIIEYIYIKRNCFVHNGNKIDSNTNIKLKKIVHPVKEYSIVTESKRLRTKINRIIPKIHDRVINKIKSKR
jgi:hypothetical protein